MTVTVSIPAAASASNNTALLAARISSARHAYSRCFWSKAVSSMARAGVDCGSVMMVLPEWNEPGAVAGLDKVKGRGSWSGGACGASRVDSGPALRLRAALAVARGAGVLMHTPLV